MADTRTDSDVVDVTAELARETPGTPPDELLARGRDARTPLQIPRRGWKDIALRVKDEWGDDHVGLSAAGVAFYAFLALIPALAAMVSILGLTSKGDDATEVIDDLFGALPGSARDLLSTQLESITRSSSGSLSIGLVIGIALSIWTASGAIGQLVNTINTAYDEEETRSWFFRKAMALALTFGAVLFVALAVFVVVGFPVLIDQTGLGIGMRRLLNILIWPGLALAFGVALSVLYRHAPDRSDAHWTWVTVGSVFAIVTWVIVTLGFRMYVSRFGSYNETYGSLGAVVVILLWMWLTAVIVLLGAEINAEVEHQTAMDTTVGGDQPMGERGAVKADTIGVAHD
jgi:membrane protein